MSEEQNPTKAELELAALKERKAKLEQRIKTKERGLKERERKARTRRLIEQGGLVVKAGMGEIDPETLLGLLMDSAVKLSDDDTRRRWMLAGEAELNKTKKEG